MNIDAQKRELTLAVAARIKFLRLSKSMSQEELALRANLNPAYFGHIERGLKCPTIDTLYKVSTALEVSLSELLSDEAIPIGPVGQERKFYELIARIPENKRKQVLKILEDLIPLL
nr:helix-turn-helix transcriptional regulator [uncultured Oscillibacter sp.]